ncbi:MAG: substrate-binding domain-containing protein, partial [Pseudomonadota bacterium]
MLRFKWHGGQIAVLAASVAAATASEASPAAAQSVLLTNTETGLVLEGRLVGFNANVFTISTSIGNFEINGDTVECSGTGCPIGHASAFDFHISGTPSVGTALMPLMIEGFAAANDGKVSTSPGPGNVGMRYDATREGDDATEIFRAQLSESSSAEGFQALIEGRAHFSMAAGEASAGTIAAAEDAGLGDLSDFSQEYGIAIESLSLVTHPDNPIDELTTAEFAGILAGRIDNWAFLGGPDLPIEIVAADEGDGSYAEVAARMIAPQDTPRVRAPITKTSHKAAVDRVTD